MSTTLQERAGSDFDWKAFEEQFDGGNGNDGDNNNKGPGLQPVGYRGEREGQEPFRVDFLVGRVALEDCVSAVEARWELGHGLTLQERDMMAAHEELLPDEWEQE